MKAKIFFELKDNGDMSVTVHSLETCMDIIDTHISDMHAEDIEGHEYTITPVWLTDDEYEALGESESY